MTSTKPAYMPVYDQSASDLHSGRTMIPAEKLMSRSRFCISAAVLTALIVCAYYAYASDPKTSVLGDMKSSKGKDKLPTDKKDKDDWNFDTKKKTSKTKKADDDDDKFDSTSSKTGNKIGSRVKFGKQKTDDDTDDPKLTKNIKSTNEIDGDTDSKMGSLMGSSKKDKTKKSSTKKVFGGDQDHDKDGAESTDNRTTSVYEWNISETVNKFTMEWSTHPSSHLNCKGAHIASKGFNATSGGFIRSSSDIGSKSTKMNDSFHTSDFGKKSNKPFHGGPSDSAGMSATKSDRQFGAAGDSVPKALDTGKKGVGTEKKTKTDTDDDDDKFPDITDEPDTETSQTTTSTTTPRSAFKKQDTDDTADSGKTTSKTGSTWDADNEETTTKSSTLDFDDDKKTKQKSNTWDTTGTGTGMDKTDGNSNNSVNDSSTADNTTTNDSNVANTSVNQGLATRVAGYVFKRLWGSNKNKTTPAAARQQSAADVSTNKTSSRSRNVHQSKNSTQKRIVVKGGGGISLPTWPKFRRKGNQTKRKTKSNRNVTQLTLAAADNMSKTELRDLIALLQSKANKTTLNRTNDLKKSNVSSNLSNKTTHLNKTQKIVKKRATSMSQTSDQLKPLGSPKSGVDKKTNMDNSFSTTNYSTIGTSAGGRPKRSRLTTTTSTTSEKQENDKAHAKFKEMQKGGFYGHFNQDATKMPKGADTEDNVADYEPPDDIADQARTKAKSCSATEAAFKETWHNRDTHRSTSNAPLYPSSPECPQWREWVKTARLCSINEVQTVMDKDGPSYPFLRLREVTNCCASGLKRLLNVEKLEGNRKRSARHTVLQLDNQKPCRALIAGIPSDLKPYKRLQSLMQQCEWFAVDHNKTAGSIVQQEMKGIEWQEFRVGKLNVDQHQSDAVYPAKSVALAELLDDKMVVNELDYLFMDVTGDELTILADFLRNRPLGPNNKQKLKICQVNVIFKERSPSYEVLELWKNLLTKSHLLPIHVNKLDKSRYHEALFINPDSTYCVNQFFYHLCEKDSKQSVTRGNYRSGNERTTEPK